ncbi:MAG: hypothetical protein B6241_03550 [Spirochaetaceae bacterium 4572_59]|nr:MAG: hypothetical protein B6241_03550 [Spirochaetaceae bacterium 4572_59]
MKKILLLITAMVISLPVMANGAQEDGSEKINYITWADYSPELLELFTEQTGIEMDFQQLGTDYGQVARTRITGGADLDVMGVRADMRKELFNDDIMFDLTGQPVLENIKNNDAATASNGKVYGIVIGNFVEAVWYNKDMFAKYDISIPKTWKEFNTVCQTLKDAGETPLVEGFKDGWTWWYAGIGPLQRIYQNDPKMVEKLDNGEVKWTDPIWLDAFKEVEDFIKKGYYAEESTGLSGMQSKQFINDGNAAMTFAGTWNANSHVHGSDLRDFDLGVFALPSNHEGEKLQGIRIQGLVTGIAQKSKNKEASIKFLEWISDPEGGAPLYHNTNGHPSNFKGFETDLGEFSDIIRDAQELPGVESLRDDLYSLVNNSLNLALSELFVGTKTAEQVVKELQISQDKIIADAN